jgi:hypothetical protein
MVASEMVGVLKDLCIEIGVELASYSITEIKKDATGKGNAGKPVMIAKAIGYKPEDDNAADAIHLYLLTKRLTTMKIKLLSDRILVKLMRLKRDSFGIILPEIKKTETKVLLWLLVQR